MLFARGIVVKEPRFPQAFWECVDVVRHMWSVWATQWLNWTDAEMADGPLNWLDHDPFLIVGHGPRYVLVGEEDGSFTVMDQTTKAAAIWNDQMLFGLPFDEADDLLETMNQLTSENP